MNTSPPDDLTGKSVLVTGGTGSFGKAFVAAAAPETSGVERVVVYSRDELKQFEMAQTFPQTKDGRIRYFIGGIRDGDDGSGAPARVDIIVHAAALKRVPRGIQSHGMHQDQHLRGRACGGSGAGSRRGNGNYY